MSKRQGFSIDEKRIVYAKCNGCCALCGKPIKFKRITIDHKIPLSKGGNNDISNLQIACYWCNMAKGNMMDNEWLDMIWGLFWHNFKDIVKTHYINTIHR